MKIWFHVMHCLLRAENEEVPPGVKVSGTAKVVFNDDDYFRKVGCDVL